MTASYEEFDVNINDWNLIFHINAQVVYYNLFFWDKSWGTSMYLVYVKVTLLLLYKKCV